MTAYQQSENQRDQSLSQAVLKTGGLLVANMALYSVLSAGASVATRAIGKFGSATINHLAKKTTNQIIQRANKSLIKLSKPGVFDVGEALGIPIPRTVSGTFGRKVSEFAQEQVVSTTSMFIAQNISAISDGRDLSPGQLLMESIVTDLAFKAVQVPSVLVWNKIKNSSKVKKFTNQVYEKIKPFAQNLDVDLSFVSAKSSLRSKAEMGTVADPNSRMSSFNYKFGITRGAKGIKNNVLSVFDLIATNRETRQEFLVARQDVQFDTYNAEFRKLPEQFKAELSATKLKHRRYYDKNNKYIDRAYDNAESGVSHLTVTMMRAFSFENVPILNTLFLNRKLAANYEADSVISVTTSTASKQKSVFIGNRNVVGIDEAAKIRNLLGMQNDADISQSQIAQDFLSANYGKSMEDGNIMIPVGYSFVNTSSGSFITPIKSKSGTGVGTLTQFNSKKSTTGLDSDAGSWYILQDVGRRSRTAQVMAQTIYPGADIESASDTIGPFGIKRKESSIAEAVFTPDSIVSIQKLGSGQDFGQVSNQLRKDIRADIYAGSYNDSYEALGKYGRYNTDGANFDSEIDDILGQLDGDIINLPNQSIGKDTMRDRMNQVNGILDSYPTTDPLQIYDWDEYQTIMKMEFQTSIKDTTKLEQILLGADSELGLSYATISDRVVFTGDVPDGINRDYMDFQKVKDITSKFGKYTTIGKDIKRFTSRNGIDIRNADTDAHNNTSYFLTSHVSNDLASENTRIISPVKRDPKGDDFENIVTIDDAIGFATMASVNDLAGNMGLNVGLTMDDELGSFMIKLASKGGLMVGGLSLGMAAVNTVLTSGAFDGTKLEDGIFGFMGTAYNDLYMAGNTIANKTGISFVMSSLNEAIPGIVNSPFGGALLSGLPLLLGAAKGYSSGTRGGLLTGLAAGAFGSAVFGGLGASVLDAYDVTMGLDEAYGIASGEESVGIRRSRYWGMTSTSFWGKTTQYFRNTQFLNATLSGTSTYDLMGDPITQLSEMIGMSSPLDRNQYSRPYIDVSSMPNSILGGSGYSASTAFGTLGTGNPGGMAMSNSIDRIADLYGIRGFLMKDVVLGKLGIDITSNSSPTIADVSSAYGEARVFDSFQLGGFFGSSEYMRRILPKYNGNDRINPLRNLMPDWLPGSNYMINFKEGDAYTKLTDGELRLPGSGHLSTNDVLLDMPYDLSVMGMLSDEDAVNAAVYGDIETDQSMNVVKTAMERNYISNVKESAQLQGFRLLENKTYYTGDNVIATADFEYNNTATNVEVVSSRVYDGITKQGNSSVYQKKANLLSAISKKNSEYIIINADTSEQYVIYGEAKASDLRTEINRIDKLKPKIIDKMKNSGMGINNLYSIVDRFKVLADVAPYSSEYRQYEKIIRQMIQRNELTDDQIIQIGSAMENREYVVNGVHTGKGKQSFLSNILPTKLLNPDNIDPITLYKENAIYSTGMQTWTNPAGYFKEDFALNVSGEINPIKRAIGSGFLYRTLYGNTAGMYGALQALTTSTISSLNGGTHIRDTYDITRDTLMQQEALDYKRNLAFDEGFKNQNNLYASMMYGGSDDAQSLSKSLTSEDRYYYEAFSEETDPERQTEILSSVSPQMRHILEIEWGYDTTPNNMDEYTNYINSIGDDSKLMEYGLQTKYLVTKQLDNLQIDPRVIGLGFSQQRNAMAIDPYSNVTFGDTNTSGDESLIRKALGLNTIIKINGYNMEGNKSMVVNIIIG